MKICTKCNLEHNKSGLFCSRSCANSRGPRTDEFKRRVSAKLKGVAPASKGKYLVERVTKNCQTCNNSFLTKITSSNIFCSSKCRPSIKGGYRQGSGRAKTGYHKGIYCGSTYELVWVIHKLDNGIEFKRFEGSLDKDGIRYYPDFVAGNTIYEIKGYEKQESVDRKTKVAESFGYKVIVLRKDDLQEEFDWAKKNYQYKELFELYDGYKPKYNLICSCCQKEFFRNRKPKTDVVFCSRKCAGRYQNSYRVWTPEMKKKISVSLTGRTVKPYKRKYKQIWITDGKINTRIKEGDFIPEGFKQGRSKSL